ncbi:MAG: AmpG family muropeptide MFS transporter [Gammaproteobacteria bacterium]|nr:AmpG family muropeptide MFS transporter [Gammaproteobacteria bacterium]
MITLPWAFKLVTGPLMDRFEFLPMGRRRPWVISVQLGLSLSLLALMLVNNPAEQIGLLTSPAVDPWRRRGGTSRRQFFPCCVRWH